jgi:hypothetical protein
MREEGFYWVFGLSWSNNPYWFIARWDGHSFWYDGDDFSEDSIMEIDERQLVRDTYCLQSKVLIEKSNLTAK